MKQFTKDELNQILAYVLTRLCWRDTDTVENSHAGTSITCDMAFYKDVTNSISTKLKEWIPKLKKELHYQCKYYKANPNRTKREVYLVFALYAPQYIHWDTPILLNVPYNGNLIEFLLQGEVLKACQQHSILDDHTMCILNHDVYNLMYTLVHHKHIHITPY
jgi:hypothetical protein